jgi:hypothetical protein
MSIEQTVSNSNQRELLSTDVQLSDEPDRLFQQPKGRHHSRKSRDRRGRLILLSMVDCLYHIIESLQWLDETKKAYSELGDLLVCTPASQVSVVS